MTIRILDALLTRIPRKTSNGLRNPLVHKCSVRRVFFFGGVNWKVYR